MTLRKSLRLGKPLDELALRVPAVDLRRLDQVAAELVRSLAPGLTLGLVGTLGAGKTRWTQALATALGIDPAEVTSPTFTLLQSHNASASGDAPRRLHHLDAYRLADEDEFIELGVEELFDDPDAWTVVEWADKVATAMPPETVWVWIEFEPQGERRVLEFFARSPEVRNALETLGRRLPAPPASSPRR